MNQTLESFLSNLPIQDQAQRMSPLISETLEKISAKWENKKRLRAQFKIRVQSNMII